jgi:hypothetical protein
VSNEDKRRRRDGSTTQLSVADLIARREAETQPIPIIRVEDFADTDDTDAEDTVRFAPVKHSPLSGRELHVAELLRREGRPSDKERGGLSMSKLVALTSGGVVLCGSVAFGASQWLSSPDERPLADVRFDTRPAARATNTPGAIDLNAAAKPQQTTPTTTDPTTQPQAQQPAGKRPVTQQQDTGTTTTDPTTADPTTPSESTTTPPPETTTPPSSTTPAPPSSSDSVPPSSSTPPPSSSTPSTPPSEPVIGIGLDLGKIIAPLGGFDFFAA